MSWLARSIGKSLRIDEEDGADEEERGLDDAVPRPTPYDAVLPDLRPRGITLTDENIRSSGSDSVAAENDCGDQNLDDNNNRRGVKEDLSELKDSLTRQFRGVASFLAPPSLPPLSQRSGSIHFKSKLNGTGSGNGDYVEDEETEEHDERESGQFPELAYFSRSEDCYTNVIEDAIGITEEVLTFAKNIAHHPETWLDFPISEEEFDGFPS
ncbi:hypothetical protein OROGR_032912 [Orobanche gracilis]